MNKRKLSYLAAKDALLIAHKWSIRYWSLEEWNRQVDDLAYALRLNKTEDWMEAYETEEAMQTARYDWMELIKIKLEDL